MMESQQMMEFLLAMRQEMNDNTKAMQEQADANTKAMREDMKADRERADAENKAWQERMETIWQADQEKTDIKLKEFTESVEKTQMELQTAEVSLDVRTRKLQEDLTETKHELQVRLEAIETRTEVGNAPAASAAPLPTFSRSTSWSVFRRQFKTIAKHNKWLREEKLTYLVTALKGRAADVLYGIPADTTYEETLQALEDHFGDQHFAAAYCCQLTTRTQKAGESL
jgi:hypothetical protein